MWENKKEGKDVGWKVLDSGERGEKKKRTLE